MRIAVSRLAVGSSAAVVARRAKAAHHPGFAPSASASSAFPRGVRAMASAEEAAAKAAAAQANDDAPTIFDKIISKQIPATIIYEDDKALAFRDISPQAPTHFLVIPKNRAGLTRLSKATEAHKEILGHLMYVAQLVAKQEKLDDGFRVVVNDGTNACQSVWHIHLHVLGGRSFTWPPG